MGIQGNALFLKLMTLSLTIGATRFCRIRGSKKQTLFKRIYRMLYFDHNFELRCISSRSTSTQAVMASTTGTARIATHGSCLPDSGI